MTLILGIDPGSRLTGYGIINATGNKLGYVACGCIRLPDIDHPARLKLIFDNLCQIIEQYAPQECAIEEVCLLGAQAGAGARQCDGGLSASQSRALRIFSSQGQTGIGRKRQCRKGTGSAYGQSVAWGDRQCAGRCSRCARHRDLPCQYQRESSANKRSNVISQQQAAE